MFFARVMIKIKSCMEIMRGLAKPSFSQVGEDRIVHFLFQSLGIDKPSYIDIGANNPVLDSNTYYFYLLGSTGVIIEPDPELYKKLRRKRRKDICINAGI